MKRCFKMVISTVIAVSLVLALCMADVTALPIPTGETERSVVEIADGVRMTKFALSGTPYGLQKVNAVEFDLAQENLYLEILKGDYIVSKKTMDAYVKQYNTEHKSEGKEVICAVNGDLWMTSVHSNTNVTTSVLQVPRGVLISDGIIYCSSQTKNEATYASNGEGHSTFWAFGITDEYVPMIGQPIVNITVKNTDKSLETTTKALNRLPAHDSLVIYNGDCNYSNYALEDAYEVVLSDINGEFRCNGTVSGTVSAIYSANDGTSPTLTKDSVVLTARGTAIDKISEYSVGDDVTIDISITDNSGRDNDWSKAILAIGGHIPLVLDGASQNITGSTTGYPSTIVGYKNDGTIIFIQNDGRRENWSTGFSFSTADDLMVELGVNSAINLDGGGSSTMVVGEEVVNKPSDGSPRAVINGIALVSGPARNAQAAFEPELPYRFNARYINFVEKGAVKQLAKGYANATTVSAVEGAARLTVSGNTNDPYLYYDVDAAYNTLQGNKYKQIVIKYRTSPGASCALSELFLCAGAVLSPTGGKSVSFGIETDGLWHTKIIDLSSNADWTGSIYGLRLDYFGGNALQGEYMDIAFIAFAKSMEEAEGYAAGTAEIPGVPAESSAITPKAGSGYSVGGDYLKGVEGGTDIYDFVDNITGTRLEIYDQDWKPVDSSSIATGYHVRSYDISLEIADTYTIIVTGDIDCDGETSPYDALLALQNDAALTTLEELPFMAADINGDGYCDSYDALLILLKDAQKVQ